MKKNPAVKKAVKTVARKAKAAVPRAGGRKKTMTKYVAPGVALLGSGLLATAGVVLKSQLERVLRAGIESAVAGGASARHLAADQLDLEKLLAHVGLQRRHTPVRGAGLGALAGAVVGSALTLWLAPLLKQELAARTRPDSQLKQPPANSTVNHHSV
jgi:hypothetical protein